MSKPIIAICYDFDKTLSIDDMQTFSIIPNLGYETNEFWDICERFTKINNVDSILSYLRVLIDECKKKGIKLTREYLNKAGESIQLYDGVKTWFKRLNKYAEKCGVVLEHYVISSGNREIIEGSPIYNEFKQVYASEYLYDENGEAYWPKTVTNFTVKTQYIFRICKGIKDLTEAEKVNEKVDKKRVQFRNMIYIGDGYTDIPCMSLIKGKGGIAISVYGDENKEVSKMLIKDGRVNYACKNDYSSGSELEKLLKLIIDSISTRERLISKESKKI